MRSGTADKPRLISPDVFVWEVGAEDAAGYGVAVTTDPTLMASLSWATGGRGDDQVLVARQYSPSLVAAGYPLLETVDTSRTSVSEQSTLDGYAAGALRVSQAPAEFRSFKASLNGQPALGEYTVGDLTRLVIDGDPYVPDGEYTHRILAMGGSLDSDWADITCGEVYTDG